MSEAELGCGEAAVFVDGIGQHGAHVHGHQAGAHDHADQFGVERAQVQAAVWQLK